MTGDHIIDKQIWADCSEVLAGALCTVLSLTGDEPGHVQDQAWKDAEDAVEKYIELRALENGNIFDDPVFEEKHRARIDKILKGSLE